MSTVNSYELMLSTWEKAQKSIDSAAYNRNTQDRQLLLFGKLCWEEQIPKPDLVEFVLIHQGGAQSEIEHVLLAYSLFG